jgi:hypothetical protein
MKCGISAPIKMMFLHLIWGPLIDIIIYHSIIKHLLSNPYVKVLKSLPRPIPCNRVIFGGSFQRVQDLYYVTKLLYTNLWSMKESTTDYLMNLHRLYMAEVGRFIKALKENAPRNELVIIRTNVKKLFAEIRKLSVSGNPNELNSQ